MRSIHSFIVEPVNDRRYDNVRKIGGMEFITSVSEEDHMASNRFAIVKTECSGICFQQCPIKLQL